MQTATLVPSATSKRNNWSTVLLTLLPIVVAVLFYHPEWLTGGNAYLGPDGAFYIYADVGELTGDSVAFAAEVLQEAGVAVTPGVDFDPVRGGRWLRFSYARATADIVEGLARLEMYMGQRGLRDRASGGDI